MGTLGLFLALDPILLAVKMETVLHTVFTHVGSLSSFGLAFLGDPRPEGVTMSQVYLCLDGRNEIERERERVKEQENLLVPLLILCEFL